MGGEAGRGAEQGSVGGLAGQGAEPRDHCVPVACLGIRLVGDGAPLRGRDLTLGKHPRAGSPDPPAVTTDPQKHGEDRHDESHGEDGPEDRHRPPGTLSLIHI